ncbi:MAG: hypothetical protein H6R04_1155 [Burkholderiaceae bacterium]|nr:hypothetical protein [Burkholderiaceae bacterium]
MTRGYKLIPLGEVEPGMVLSDDYLDRHGKVLLPKGSVLSEKLLASLQRYEMELVPIVVDDTPPQDKVLRREYHRGRLETLFRKHDYGQPEQNANDILQQHMRYFRLGEGA